MTSSRSPRARLLAVPGGPVSDAGLDRHGKRAGVPAEADVLALRRDSSLPLIALVSFCAYFARTFVFPHIPILFWGDQLLHANSVARMRRRDQGPARLRG